MTASVWTGFLEKGGSTVPKAIPVLTGYVSKRLPVLTGYVSVCLLCRRSRPVSWHLLTLDLAGSLAVHPQTRCSNRWTLSLLVLFALSVLLL